jgi:hypothetical protein
VCRLPGVGIAVWHCGHVRLIFPIGGSLGSSCKQAPPSVLSYSLLHLFCFETLKNSRVKKKVLCFLEVVVPSCQIYVGGVSHRSVVTLQNNLVEIRSDSFKLLKMMKRPVPHVVGSIGAWLHIFQVVFSSLTIVLLPSAMECRNRFVAPFLLISRQIAKWMF